MCPDKKIRYQLVSFGSSFANCFRMDPTLLLPPDLYSLETIFPFLGSSSFCLPQVVSQVSWDGLFFYHWGWHGGRVVTLSSPTSEVGVRFTALPQVGKLVVACHWSAIYSTEP